MDVRRLELLRELAERGSVGAVATATHRTPSAVSQQLKVLEREIGTALTERHGRGIKLTEAGRALARTATDIAVAMERAEALWSEYMGTPSGVVTLATFPTAGQMFLPGLLRRVVEHPNVRLVVADHDPTLEGFATLAQDFDLVLAHSPTGPRAWRGSGLQVTELMSEPLDIALPPGHRLLEKDVLKPADLVGEPWIGVPLDMPFQQVLIEIEEITGEPPRVLQRFADTRIVEALVDAGHGVAILPRFTAGSTKTAIGTRPLKGVTVERHISVLTRPDRAERPSVQLILRMLEEEASIIAATNGLIAASSPRR
ncbi:LysR family transcriptional regulator [Herbiconiux sp. L3-i23]|jgi:DNA-binding transcriptional LysR family regulator|uniref:LysR family transcriptional regulator n=1 Tax=Herbiconiux sp. L3-i23 TaxID=2905871 RepID=UPI00206A67C8|nr:LysR family transcriptional regulator [Herbiconiux sp. L3-i23]BDI23464.1 LysR family transcriptional regulator [Herbiconiux sp. L3-i23]